MWCELNNYKLFFKYFLTKNLFTFKYESHSLSESTSYYELYSWKYEESLWESPKENSWKSMLEGS